MGGHACLGLERPLASAVSGAVWKRTGKNTKQTRFVHGYVFVIHGYVFGLFMVMYFDVRSYVLFSSQLELSLVISQVLNRSRFFLNVLRVVQ